MTRSDTCNSVHIGARASHLTSHHMKFTAFFITLLIASATSVPAIAEAKTTACGADGYLFTWPESDICVTVDDVKGVKGEFKEFFNKER